LGTDRGQICPDVVQSSPENIVDSWQMQELD
jgi:hypothetical protein